MLSGVNTTTNPDVDMQELRHAKSTLEGLGSGELSGSAAPRDAYNAIEELGLAMQTDSMPDRKTHVSSARVFSQGLQARIEMGSRAAPLAELSQQIAQCVDSMEKGHVARAAEGMAHCFRTVGTLGGKKAVA